MPRAPRVPYTVRRELKAYGLSYAKIHAIHPEIPLGTIKTNILREHTRDDNKSRPRPGTPRKITEEG
jgi:hypothetical protein